MSELFPVRVNPFLEELRFPSKQTGSLKMVPMHINPLSAKKQTKFRLQIPPPPPPPIKKKVKSKLYHIEN